MSLWEGILRFSKVTNLTSMQRRLAVGLRQVLCPLIRLNCTAATSTPEHEKPCSSRAVRSCGAVRAYACKCVRKVARSLGNRYRAIAKPAASADLAGTQANLARRQGTVIVDPAASLALRARVHRRCPFTLVDRSLA
jgi:hypothetical protein